MNNQISYGFRVENLGLTQESSAADADPCGVAGVSGA
jgi:hypothetical protein